MIDQANCNHARGYERTLETERFYITIVRCYGCGKFSRAATREKKPVALTNEQ